MFLAVVRLIENLRNGSYNNLFKACCRSKKFEQSMRDFYTLCVLNIYNYEKMALIQVDHTLEFTEYKKKIDEIFENFLVDMWRKISTDTTYQECANKSINIRSAQNCKARALVHLSNYIKKYDYKTLLNILDATTEEKTSKILYSRYLTNSLLNELNLFLNRVYPTDF